MIAVIPFAALSWLGPNLGIVLATVFSVTLVSTLLLPAEPLPLGETYRRDGAEAKDLPPVIHLVFDEQIGVEGLHEFRTSKLPGELRAPYIRLPMFACAGNIIPIPSYTRDARKTTIGEIA